MTISRPILRYYGGKWNIAPWIIGHFPKHSVYVEPFGGAASVLMRKSRSIVEIYNDTWGDVVNVFRVLRDPALASALERSIRLTPYAREEFNLCSAAEMDAISDPVERARRSIFRAFSGFGSGGMNSAHNTGFRSQIRRNSLTDISTIAHEWARYPDHISSYTARLQGVLIENRDALEVMAQYDGADTLFYIDPPYVWETRDMSHSKSYYAHDLCDEEHRSLASALHQLKGMVVLSGYRCDLYDELYGDWAREDIGSWASGAHKRTESLWMPRCNQVQLSLQEADHNTLPLNEAALRER